MSTENNDLFDRVQVDLVERPRPTGSPKDETDFETSLAAATMDNLRAWVRKLHARWAQADEMVQIAKEARDQIHKASIEMADAARHAAENEEMRAEVKALRHRLTEFSDDHIAARVRDAIAKATLALEENLASSLALIKEQSVQITELTKSKAKLREALNRAKIAIKL